MFHPVGDVRLELLKKPTDAGCYGAGFISRNKRESGANQERLGLVGGKVEKVGPTKGDRGANQGRLGLMGESGANLGRLGSQLGEVKTH